MFNLFWRPFVPGFRVRPHDEVPGFNVDQNSLPSRWFNGMLPDAVTQGYPDSPQTEMPYSISVPALGPEGMVQPTPLIGLAGFRVSPQDDVPGFNVGLRDDAPGFGLDDDVEEQETNWSSQTPPPDTEEPVQPSPPQFPEWVYKLVTWLPQSLAAFDPIIPRRLAINSLPGMPSAMPPDAAQPASSNAPQQLAGPDIASRTVATRVTASQLGAGEAMSSTWHRPQTGGWPHTQVAKLDNPWSAEITRRTIGLPSMMEAKPVAESNFIVASSRAASEPASRPTLLEYRQQLSAPVGTAIAEVNQPHQPDIRMAPLEREPERMSSPFTGANRPLDVGGRAEDSRLIGQAYAQVEKPQVAPRVDFRRDAAGLPSGTILSSIRPPELSSSQGRASAGAIAPTFISSATETV
ncbi:hypothetical protein [Reyranella soli]|uniref:Uncharacterized protein n=1 Tax=Reyranella soli TaxID=1230389 RepID=A0A512N9H8_9HYPH|nr:hypothetical protein [Reyranella soli]GEP55624.1 hypothetical protein RSO01_27900 [Reyranella soli]